MGYTAAPHHDIIINDPVLTQHGFTKFSLPLNGGNGTTSVMVVHNTDNSKIMYCHFYKSDLDKSVTALEEKILSDGIMIDDDTADSIIRYFRNECVLLSEDEDCEFFKNENGNGNGNGKSSSSSSEQRQQEQQQKPKPKRPYPAYKYSNKGKGDLQEAVILAGLPVFLKHENGEIKTIQQIEEASRIIKPPNIEEYPYEPYEFVNEEEIRSYFDRAKKESIDSLFQKAKAIVKKYNDQDEHKLILLAGDIIWSYFQDRFSTTHYTVIVGGNGSGKTTIGDTFAAIGYRTVTMTDPSAANIFRVLGKIEYGQCTIVMDEAEKVDKSPDLMSILKAGYQFNARVSKINMNEEVQQWFYPYCLKFIIAERSPNQNDAKGVLDRTFSYTTYKGKPQNDVKEILNPAGDQRRQQLLDELVDFRKLMLVYRLIHFKDAIPDIDIGLDGRDKELCKPLLQLFDNTESYSEIRATLQKFLDAKNQKKSNPIEAALLPLIVNILSLLGKKEISAKYIWDEIVGITPNGIKEGKIIEGYYDSKKPNEYQTADYGTIYRNTITNIICDKFGAERKRNENGSILTFDFEKLSRVAKIYNIETNIQKKLVELDHEGNVGSTEAGSSSVEDDHAKIVNNQSNNGEKSVDTKENHVDNTIQKDTKEPIVSEEPTEPTSTVSELSKNDIEEFFNDNPGTPWKWIEHTIEVSPCRSIIHQDEDGWYYCKLHSVIKHEHVTRAVRLRSLNLSEIEQHCKYHKPEVHKAEILKQLGLEAQGKSWETR